MDNVYVIDPNPRSAPPVSPSGRKHTNFLGLLAAVLVIGGAFAALMIWSSSNSPLLDVIPFKPRRTPAQIVSNLPTISPEQQTQAAATVKNLKALPTAQQQEMARIISQLQ